jgi:hypothetical protein
MVFGHRYSVAVLVVNDDCSFCVVAHGCWEMQWNGVRGLPTIWQAPLLLAAFR